MYLCTLNGIKANATIGNGILQECLSVATCWNLQSPGSSPYQLGGEKDWTTLYESLIIVVIIVNTVTIKKDVTKKETESDKDDLFSFIVMSYTL